MNMRAVKGFGFFVIFTILFFCCVNFVMAQTITGCFKNSDCGDGAICDDNKGECVSPVKIEREKTKYCVKQELLTCHEMMLGDVETKDSEGNVVTVSAPVFAGEVDDKEIAGMALWPEDYLTLEGSMVLMSGDMYRTFMCKFPKESIPKTITDADGWGMCEGITIGSDPQGYYCALGNSGAYQYVSTCDYEEAEKKVVEVKQEQVAASEAAAAAAAAEKVLPDQSLAFGTGNVTCGTRTFQCTRGGWFSGVSDQCYCCGQCTPDDVLTVGNEVLKWLFRIIGAIGLAMFVWGGFNWVISAGDSSRVSAGQNTIKNVIFGLLIMFGSGAFVMLIQDSLGIDKSVNITISNEGPKYVASTTSSGGTEKVVHGGKAIATECTVVKGGNSECEEPLFCYAADGQNKGICLPKNPADSVEPGDVCYILPGTGKDMCKIGSECKVEGDKTPGTQGVCPSLETDQNLGVGEKCTSDADCSGKKSLFMVSATCYKKTGNCIPVKGRGLEVGEVCYVLPGSENDCYSDTQKSLLTGKITKYSLLCVQNPNSEDPKAGRVTGNPGVCMNYNNKERGYACSYSWECLTTDSCKPIPKAMNGLYCVSKGLNTDPSFSTRYCTELDLRPEVGGVLNVDNCPVGWKCDPGTESCKPMSDD